MENMDYYYDKIADILLENHIIEKREDFKISKLHYFEYCIEKMLKDIDNKLKDTMYEFTYDSKFVFKILLSFDAVKDLITNQDYRIKTFLVNDDREKHFTIGYAKLKSFKSDENKSIIKHFYEKFRKNDKIKRFIKDKISKFNTKEISVTNWIMLLSGIIIGLVITTLFYLSDNQIKIAYQEGIEVGQQQYQDYIYNKYDSLICHLQKDQGVLFWKVIYKQDSIIITK